VWHTARKLVFADQTIAGAVGKRGLLPHLTSTEQIGENSPVWKPAAAWMVSNSWQGSPRRRACQMLNWFPDDHLGYQLLKVPTLAKSWRRAYANKFFFSG